MSSAVVDAMCAALSIRIGGQHVFDEQATKERQRPTRVPLLKKELTTTQKSFFFTSTNTKIFTNICRQQNIVKLIFAYCFHNHDAFLFQLFHSLARRHKTRTTLIQ